MTFVDCGHVVVKVYNAGQWCWVSQDEPIRVKDERGWELGFNQAPLLRNYRLFEGIRGILENLYPSQEVDPRLRFYVGVRGADKEAVGVLVVGKGVEGAIWVAGSECGEGIVVTL